MVCKLSFYVFPSLRYIVRLDRLSGLSIFYISTIGHHNVKKIVLVSSSILSVFVLTACGGGSSNSNPVSSSSQSSSTISSHSSSAISSQSSNVIPSEFVGVWDASIDEGKDGFDEYTLLLMSVAKSPVMTLLATPLMTGAIAIG